MKSRCACGAIYNIKPEFLGKKTLCKNCGQSFLITALPYSQSPPDLSLPEYLEVQGSSLSASSAAESPRVGPLELEFVPPQEEILLEEVEPIQGPTLEPTASRPSVQIVSADLQAFAAQAEADLQAGGQRPLLALAVAAVAGALVGAGLMGLVRQSEVDGLKARLAVGGLEFQGHSQNGRKLEALKNELDSIHGEIRLLEVAEYPAGSIPQALTSAAILEYKTVEALLRQQVAALESGAELTVSARATAPDSQLAEAVEEEMARLEAKLEELRLEADGLAEEPKSLVQTAIATEELNLAILNRNRLIARYGLSAPLPPLHF